jgi:hypothetical protein
LIPLVAITGNPRQSENERKRMNSYLEPNISADDVNGLPGEVRYVLLPVAGFIDLLLVEAGDVANGRILI